MAITLPTTPSVGDLWQAGDTQYTWNGVGWYSPSLTSDFVAKSADTMEGVLSLSGTPGTTLSAVNKQYVDERELNSSGSETVTITSARLPEAPINPTKGSTQFDYITYELIGHKLYSIKMVYRQTTSGTKGLGTYLIKLPGGLSFDTTRHPLSTNPYINETFFVDLEDMCREPSSSGRISTDVSGTAQLVQAVPFSATTFRIAGNIPLQGIGVNGWFWSSDFFHLNTASLLVTCSFIMKAL